MPINEKGLWTSATLDERGRAVFGGLTEGGGFVFGTPSTPPPTTSLPIPTVTSVSRSIISDEVGANIVNIKFTFDIDVTSWSVNVMGVDQITGTIADSGGVVTAGVEITATIDWTELYQEGQNKVNIYGQNANGWTPYEPVNTILVYDSFNREDNTTLGTPEIGEVAYGYNSTTRYGIIDNQAYPSAVPSWIQPTYVPVSADNYAVEIKFVELGQYSPALYLRLPYDTPTYTNSIILYRENYDSTTGIGGNWVLKKLTGGVFEPMIPNLAPANNGDVLRGECFQDGTIKVYVNGILCGTIIDTYILSNPINVGFGASTTTVRIENFQVELLVNG